MVDLARGGDIPHVLHGVQKDYKRLYYSDHMAALRVPVTLQAGYGLIEQGTTLAKNLSAARARAGRLLPYAPTTFPASIDTARAYLVANSGTTDKFVYVSMEDSYKFAVGDDVVINDDTTAAENKGAITAIDRTSENHRAKITFTTAIGGTAFTTARSAYIIVEAGTSGNNYSDCVGILEKTVDTGTGVTAKGAVATLILGNCVLYTGCLTNLDAAAIADISSAAFGQYTYIR
jgi:hypothetical protein